MFKKNCKILQIFLNNTIPLSNLLFSNIIACILLSDKLNDFFQKSIFIAASPVEKK